MNKRAEQDDIAALERLKDFPPRMNSRMAMQAVPCPTLNAWYMWAKRHNVPRFSNGSVDKADIIRALRRPDGRKNNGRTFVGR